MKGTALVRVLAMVLIVAILLAIAVLHLLGAENVVQVTVELAIIGISILGTLAFQMLVWPERFLGKVSESQLGSEKTTSLPQRSETSDIVLNEQMTSQVMGLARGGFREALRANLRIIGTDLELRLHTRLVVWFSVEPSLRERLITNKEEYDALEDLAKSLEHRSDSSYDTPDFDKWDNLCKAQYELLKRTDLFPSS
jgi:hypothetical protein